MAGVKISALPSVTTPVSTDVFPLVQSGVTYKCTLGQLTDLVSDVNSLRVATTGALTATYDNGTSGVGATLTNSGALAALSIDGVSVSLNDHVLVKDQASTLQNGIYTVTTVGSGVVAWVLTRDANYDQPSEINPGDFFTVFAGTTNANTQWIETATVTTIGTDPITFSSNIIAGTGLTKTNNTISLTVPVAMANGGTNKVMVAANGAVVYSDADSLELSAVGSAGQVFQSNGAGAPTWSTPTYPSTSGVAGVILRSNGTNNVYSTSTFADTYAINSIPYASAANTITALAPALSSVLISSAASTGVPAWSGALTNGQLIIGSTGATPVVAGLTAGTGISIGTGAGTITINSTGSGMTITEVTGISQAMAVNNGYIANNVALVTLTLPDTAAIGDTVSVIGKGAGGWLIAQNAGETIHFNSSNTTTGVGGSLASTVQYNCVELMCITANTDWVVVDVVGNLTVV